MDERRFKPQKFGKFVLTKKIAVGGMAEIYRAESYGVDGFKKTAALKKILPHCSADKDFITMLVDEAKLSVLLSHTNIVQVYELGKYDDDYYISMEYIHGINMRDVLYRARETNVRIPTDIAIYIVSEICKGLDYAHRKTDENNEPLNIIHRDISPQNILLSFEGEVKIGDFGIAKAAMNISHTMAGVLKGKIAYMSPEQALGKPLDNRTDIFSVGILLYEALTNKRLFTGESQFEVLKMIRETRIREEELPNDVAKELRAIVAKGLAYDRENRYQTAGDMQTELIRNLYSKYPDFTPRKLSEYVRTMFADVLEAEKAEKIPDKEYEAITRTVQASNVELANQIDIVASAPHEVTTTSSGATPIVSGEEELEEEKMPSITGAAIKAKAKRALNYLITALALSAVAYGIYKFTPATMWLKEKLTPSEPVVMSTAQITTDPAGASISVDGEKTNLITPADVPDLEVGKKYALKLELQNYAPVERLVEPKSATPIRIAAVLQRLTSTLQLSSNPPGAQIFLNGQDLGRATPTTIEKIPVNEPQKITLKKEGFPDNEQMVNLSTPEPQILNIELAAITPEAGTLKFSSVPAGAQIIINGKNTGRITPAEISAPLGSYSVELTLEGYEAWKKDLEVAKSEPYDITAMLLKTTLAPEVEKPLPPPPKEAAPKEEVKPPAPVATTGTLHVTSSPSGATVILDGKGTGQKTPAVIAGVSAGRHNVSLSLQGYESWRGAANVKAGEKSFVKGTMASLAPKEEAPPKEVAPAKPEKPAKPVEEAVVTGGQGKVRISSSPSGADVFVNGTYQGKTPTTASVPSGKVTVLVDKEGLSRYSRTVNVKPNQTVDLSNIQLEGLYGEVSLSSNPPRANIVFDGKSIPPKTPVTIRKVRRDQPHSVTISLPGYQPWSRTFRLSGETTNINAELQKQ